MGYHDRAGITDLASDGDTDILSLSKDTGFGDELLPIFLFIPDRKRSEHYHIPLSAEKAEELHQWLGEYLKEKKAAASA